MSDTFVTRTVPVDFGRPAYSWLGDKILCALREGLSNASNYNAKTARLLHIEWRTKRYLLIMHDTHDPFEDGREIETVGVVPNVTTQRGEALNGTGLAATASYLSSPANFVIASHTKHDGFRAFRGYADYSSGSEWKTEEVTQEWRETLSTLLGGKLFNSNTVFYIYPIARNTGENIFNLEIINNLPFICPGYIGKGSRSNGDPISGSEYDPDGALKVYVSTGVVKEDSTFPQLERKGGSWRRTVTPKAEFVERYCDRVFEFQPDPFLVELDSDTGISVLVKSATVRVYAFPVERERDEWFKTIRDGEKFNFEKGSGSAPGKAPSNKSFGFFPCLHGGLRQFSRYLTNAAWMNHDVRSFMAELGLQYISNETKFCVIEFYVNEIERRIDCQQTAFPPMEFAAHLERKPDFMFGDRTLVRKLFLNACASVPPDDLSEAKEYFKKMFPLGDNDFIAIDFGGDVGGTPRTKEIRFDIYDAETGDVFNRECKSGDDLLLIFRHRKNGKFVSAGELSVASRCKASVLDLREEKSRRVLRIVKNNIEKITGNETIIDVPVIAVSIADMQTLDSGKWIDCFPEDYEHDGSCRPARTICLNHDDYSFQLATVIDVPQRSKREKTDTTPKARNKVLGGVPSYPYTLRHPFFLAELRSDYLELNKNHPWVIRWFKEPDPAIAKLVAELYVCLNNVSLRLKEAVDAFRDPPNIPEKDLPPDGCDERFSENNIDYPLNKVLKGMLAEDPFIAQQIEKIQNKRTKRGRNLDGEAVI